MCEMGYPETQTYWIDPTGETARGMRRYSREVARRSTKGHARPYTCAGGFHSRIVWIDRVPTITYLDRDTTRIRQEVPQFDQNDPRWPIACDCGYVFTDDDPYQTFSEEIYRRVDDSRELTLPIYSGDAPPDAQKASPGAMYHAYWLPTQWRGEDGIALSVVLPNGNVWLVDSQASNCTRPGEPHKCWCRHGDPREGHVTVDKLGDTCAAGAGSIASGDYHGFMREGLLTAA